MKYTDCIMKYTASNTNTRCLWIMFSVLCISLFIMLRFTELFLSRAAQIPCARPLRWLNSVWWCLMFLSYVLC